MAPITIAQSVADVQVPANEERNPYPWPSITCVASQNDETLVDAERNPYPWPSITCIVA